MSLPPTQFMTTWVRGHFQELKALNKDYGWVCWLFLFGLWGFLNNFFLNKILPPVIETLNRLNLCFPENVNRFFLSQGFQPHRRIESCLEDVSADICRAKCAPKSGTGQQAREELPQHSNCGAPRGFKKNNCLVRNTRCFFLLLISPAL